MRVGPTDLDLLAASLRADAGDLDTFAESLAAKLEEAMPGVVRVERRRTGLMGPKRVQRIVLDAGERQLELRVSGGAVETFCSRLSGGIVLKREQLQPEDWIRALGEAVAAEAQRSAIARQALERLLTE